MKSITQLHNISPEQLENNIVEKINTKLDSIREHLQPKEPPAWMTRKEVCKMLAISFVTLHSWTNKGILKSYKIGNQVRYKRIEVEKALIKTNDDE